VLGLRYVSGWKKKLKALVPRRLKYTLVADVLELLISRTSLLDGGDEPPAFIEFGGGGFVPIGDHLVGLMAKRAGLADGMRVVDIGCGIGRNAVALSKRCKGVSYFGFDLVRFGIAWCRKRFAGVPGYEFRHADLFNSFYNPRGVERATEHRFPLPDGRADFVFATSVFSHMPAPEVAHYLQESARCMRPGGTAYFTCFILDPESRRQIGAGVTLFRFEHARDGWFIESPAEADLAVAYERPVFEALAARAGLEVAAFHPGHWRGLAYEDFQDAYVLRKR
jgi:SAM-dependent methyltransferase